MVNCDAPELTAHLVHRAPLAALPADMPRPLWSVMIPTYNCADYLRETLASVLKQAPGPEIMQIEVIDDCSTQEDPAAVVAALGQGRVGFYRQPQNVGSVRNFQTCLERSRGQLIHLLHGDDCVRSGFYQTLQRAFATHPEIGAAFCRHVMIDAQGHWQYPSPLEQSQSGILDHWLERIGVEQRIQTPSMVVRRAVYEQLGGFDRRLSWTEDWEMWVRIAAHYPVWYEVTPLALYRLHAHSSSGKRTRTGENMQDVRRAIAIFQPLFAAHFPAATAAQLVAQVRQNWAVEALHSVAPQMLAQGDIPAALVQIQEALKCSHNLKIMRRVLPLILKIGQCWLKQNIPIYTLKISSRTVT